MNTLLKIVVTSKTNLQTKYGKGFTTVTKLLSALVKADRKKKIKTQVVYIDDKTSARRAGIAAVASITRKSCKEAIDKIYNKHAPAYLVIFGSQDIIPFQEITNPTDDEDRFVPSDLPYACDASYSTRIQSFTGPTRVMGRIPDIPGKPDLKYLKAVFDAIIRYKQVKESDLMHYFAVSAAVWKRSTQETLVNIFGNNAKLKLSPPANAKYTKTDLKPRTHFYNCHGVLMDSKFYGEQSGRYPVAQQSSLLHGKITEGTIVAAECCYGAELFDPENEDNRQISIANTYLLNKAITFMGSSTIAYGPPSGQGLADLITQYFIKNVIAGSSTGRAMLEARQQFLASSGPHLDPFELKTLAQFYLLGDPSIHVVVEKALDSGEDSAANSRLTMYNRGMNLSKSMMPAVKMGETATKRMPKSSVQINKIFRETGFTGKEKEQIFNVRMPSGKVANFTKNMSGRDEKGLHFRTYMKKPKKANDKLFTYDVLVIKESGKDVIGWRLYQRK